MNEGDVKKAREAEAIKVREAEAIERMQETPGWGIIKEWMQGWNSANITKLMKEGLDITKVNMARGEIRFMRRLHDCITHALNEAEQIKEKEKEDARRTTE